MSIPLGTQVTQVPEPALPAPAFQPSRGMLPGPAEPLADHVNIQPLDLAGAWQILISEVRLELDVSPERGLQSAANAAQTVVDMFLRALPGDSSPEAWMTAVVHTELTLQLALDKAVDAVAGWRNVSPSVVTGAREMRALVMAALADDVLNSLWLRPEWLGLAPRVERFWRRRRFARRGLNDPDLLPQPRGDEC